jgi:hypothetical protein
MAWNGIDNPNLIKYGSKLIIYVPEGMNVSSTGQKPSSVKRPEIAPVSVPTTESEKNSNNIQLQPVEENSKNEKPPQQPLLRKNLLTPFRRNDDIHSETRRYIRFYSKDTHVSERRN